MAIKQDLDAMIANAEDSLVHGGVVSLKNQRGEIALEVLQHFDDAITFVNGLREDLFDTRADMVRRNTAKVDAPEYPIRTINAIIANLMAGNLQNIDTDVMDPGKKTTSSKQYALQQLKRTKAIAEGYLRRKGYDSGVGRAVLMQGNSVNSHPDYGSDALPDRIYRP